MSQYTKYYLYKKQQRISGSSDAWVDVVPTTYSYDGNGTQTPVIVESASTDCGYVPPIEPIYEWRNISITQDYICDECMEPMYRTLTTATTCIGVDKYELDEYQVSYDSGTTWITTGTSATTLIEAYSEDCGYVPPIPPTPTVNTKINIMYKDGTLYSLDCNDNSTLTSSEIGGGSSQISVIASAYIGNCVTSIGYGAFERCSGMTTCIIGSGVTSIGYLSFGYCSDLKSIDIPSGVTSIDMYAFSHCTSLSSVTIPSSVTSITNSSFEYCTSLTSVTIDTNAALNGAFSRHTNLRQVILEDNVTRIGDSAFYNCTSLTSCTIGSGVTSIGSKAFSGCTSLSSITIPSGVTSIGTDVFYRLTSVTIDSNSIVSKTYTSTNNMEDKFGYEVIEYIIGDSVTSVGDSAFYDCNYLKSVTIGSGVTSIGSWAFGGCTSLTSLTVNATTPPTLGSNALYSTNNCPIYVPSGSVNTYKTASRWSSYASRIQAITE